MFALGVWQLQRAEQKVQRLASIEQISQTAGIGLQQVVMGDIQTMLDLPMTFSGKLDSEKYFLIDNKTHQGRVGYQVVVPIHTEWGIVFSNFGWIAGTNSRDVLPNIKLDDNILSYQGVISLPSNNAMVTETALIDDKWPKVLQQTDLAIMTQHYKQTLLPFVLLLNPDNNSEFVRNWQPVVMAPEKHIGYAIQWFLLAIAAIGVFVFANRSLFKK
jgi:cytochrome oxidase assembly protein ShyY1